MPPQIATGRRGLCQLPHSRRCISIIGRGTVIVFTILNWNFSQWAARDEASRARLRQESRRLLRWSIAGFEEARRIAFIITWSFLVAFAKLWTATVSFVMLISVEDIPLCLRIRIQIYMFRLTQHIIKYLLLAIGFSRIDHLQAKMVNIRPKPVASNKYFSIICCVRVNI